MITINEIVKRENGDAVRIESNLHIEKDKMQSDFLLFVETTKQYGKYFVTDRADAFVVGILLYAMGNGHDIKCNIPISSELKFMLENHLIFTLKKYDDNYYQTKIIADVTDEPIPNQGAVGTGISLGLDSFCTIAEYYNPNSKDLRLTHLVTLNNGTLGGYYQNNNWDYCSKKLYERISNVSKELNLPLISMNTNLPKIVCLRADYYAEYMISMCVISLKKLFKTYHVSSAGEGYVIFDCSNKFNKCCAEYDLLLFTALSEKNGIRFILGGGQYDRIDKMRVISKFPIAKKNLQSCLTEHFNCMHCLKCKRNLVAIDALGLLKEFSEVYDIDYYKKHRNEYINWMCMQVNNHGRDSNYIKRAYDLIKAREPEYIEKFELDEAAFLAKYTEVERQKNVYRNYTRLFGTFIKTPNSVERLKSWLADRKINNIIIYGVGIAPGSQVLISMSKALNINVLYIMENIKPGQKVKIPRLPESTIDYPDCDAIIICNVDKPDMIKRKLKSFVKVPVYDISEVLMMK